MPAGTVRRDPLLPRSGPRVLILGFGFGEPGVWVEVPDDALARAVGELFPDYLRVGPESSNPRPVSPSLADSEGSGAERAGGPSGRHLSVSRASEDGYLLEGDEELVGEGGWLKVEGRSRLMGLLEVALTRGLLAQRSGLVHLHGAGVGLAAGGGILALGPSGAGKSSVALAWSAAGLPLLGDDVLFLDRRGRLHPFRRLLKVERPRLAEHGFDPRETPSWDPDYPEVWFDPRAAGGWCPDPLRPRIVALLERRVDGADGGPRVEELDPPEALSLLLASTLESGASRARSVDPLCELLDRARAVRLSYRSSVGGARRLVELARAVPPDGGVGRGGADPEGSPAGGRRT